MYDSTTNPVVPLDQEETIGQVSRTFSVSLRTLRFYEDKGLLSPRRDGTHRYYSNKDRIKLKLIITGKKLGLSLSAIHELINDRKPTEYTPDIDLLSSMGLDDLRAVRDRLEDQRDDIRDALLQIEAVLTGRKNQPI